MSIALFVLVIPIVVFTAIALWLLAALLSVQGSKHRHPTYQRSRWEVDAPR